MKPKSALRNFLTLAGSSILAISSASAITLYWDADSAGNPSGGTGTWDTTVALWDNTPIGHTPTTWSNVPPDLAVFGGAAGTVTLGAPIITSGIQFNTTGYTITADSTNTLSFSTGNNNILFNNVAAATISGTVANTAANIILSTTNPFTAGTLTLNGTSATGWSGTTTINAGMTLALSGLNQALVNTTGITLNGGGITLTNADSVDQDDLDRVKDDAAITSNGGTITYTNTQNNSTKTFAETIGSVDLVRGQTNFVNTLDKTAGSQTLTLSGLTRTGASNTSAVTFSNLGGLNTTNDRIAVTGYATGFVGPWATVGTAANAQTDYALITDVSGTRYVTAANITASAENAIGVGEWVSGANVTLSGATALTATRTVNTLRYSGAAQILGLGASTFSLETFGVLNGGSGVLTISTTGSGGLTTPSGGGNLYLTAGNNGITVSAPINNNAGNVTLVKNGTGTLTLSSTTSNFSGGTVVNAGTLTISADSNLGAVSGGLTFNGTSLLNAGTIALNPGRTVTVNEGANLTDNASSGFTIGGKLTGAGAISYGLAGALNLTATNNDFTGTFNLSTSASTTYGLNVTSIGDTAGSGLINLGGAGNSGGTLRWLGNSGSTTTFSNRQFALAGGITAQTLGGVAYNTGGVISAVGSTAADNLVITKDLLITGAAGNRALHLAGANLGNNTFSGAITDGTNGGASVIGLAKSDAGLWILSNSSNSYTGVTTIVGGTLQVSTLANGSSNSSIGASTNAASNLVFGAPSATLRYTGSSNVTIDRGFTMSSGTGGGATIESSGNGTLSFDNTVAINYGTTAQTRLLTLGGTNTGDNTFGKVIANNTGLTNLTGVTKSGIGKWVLTQANTYTGATSVNNGSLEIKSGASGLTQTLGTLTFGSDGTLISNNSDIAGSLSTTFTTLSRAAGNTGNIVSTTGTNGTNNSIILTQGAGFINKGIFFNGADYAAMDTANTYVRGLIYGTDANTVTAGTITAANHVKLTSTPAAQNSVSLLSLNLSGATVGWTNNADQTLTVPGIIKSGGGASAISGGTLTASGTAELVIRTDQAADSLTISSTVSGFSGGLTKSGAGTLTLSGLNTYTGTTNVNGGALSLTSSLATAININGAATFTQSGTGFIMGGSAFNQNSTGTSTLALANTHTGITTVNAGTLAVTHGLALQNSMLTLTGGTTTYSGGAALTIGGLNSSLGSLGSANVLNGYTGIVTALTLNPVSGTATFGGIIGNGSGAMSLTKTGAGTQILQGANTYTGATTITGGTLTLSGNGSILNSTGSIILNGGLGSTNVNAGTTGMADGYVNRFNDSQGINVTVGSVGTFTYTNSSIAAGIYAETLGAVTLNGAQFNIMLTTNQAGGSGNVQTLTLGSSASNVSGSGLSRTTSTSAVTFSGAGTFNNTTNRVAVYGSTDTTATQIVGPWATTGTAATAQTDYAIYSGGYISAAGATLTAPGQTGWGSTTAGYQFAAGETLDADRTAAALRYTGAANPLALAGFTLKTNGILNGGSGLLTVSGAGALTATGTSGGNLFLTTGNHGITVSSKISDNGGAVTVVKSGTNTNALTLSGANDFTGGIVVNTGALVLSGAQSFTGGVTLNGGNFGATGAGNGITAAALNGNSLTVNGAASFYIESSQSLATSSTITVNSSGTLYLGLSNAGTATVGGVVSGSGLLDVSTRNVVAANYSNTTGVVNLTNTANTFSGDVQFTNSNGASGNHTLSVASIGDSGKVIAGLQGGNNTSTFDLNTAANADLTFNTRQFQLIGSATNGLTISNSSAQAFTINSNLDASAAAGTKTLTLGGAGTGLSTFAGTITNGGLDALNLTKNGTSTWALSGANTYNGKTIISAGTLSINSIQNAGSATANALGTPVAGPNSIIDIASLATLRYTGTGHSSDRVINLTGNGITYTLDASGSGTLALTGGITSAGTANTSTVFFTGTGTGSQSGAITNGTGTNVAAINKSNIGTWTLSGANGLTTGPTTLIGGGALILDYSTQNNSKIGATGVLNLGTNTLTSLGGGTLTLTGGSFAQTVASTNLNAGGTFITRSSGSSTLNLGTITTGAGASRGSSLSISADNIVLTNTLNNAGGVLGGWAVVGTDWAVNSTNAANGAVVALSSYTALPASGSVNTTNYSLTGSLTLAGETPVNSLKIIASADNQTLALGSNNLKPVSTNNASGIIYDGGASTNYTYNITGTGKFDSANGEASYHVYNGTLNVTAIAAHPGAGNLVKNGNGTLVLGGANGYSAITFVNQGTVRLTNAGAAGWTGAIGVQNLAALELASGVAIGSKALTITGTGVSNAGALLNVASNTSSYAGAITIGNGGARINSDASGALTLTGGVVTSVNNNVTFGGAGNTAVDTVAISGAGGLVKDGLGTVTLTATNTYTGTTTVNEGKLIVNGNISTSLLTTVKSGATLGGSGSVGALTIESGGVFAPGNSPGIETVNGNYIQDGTLQVEIQGLLPGNTATNHDQVVVNGTVTLNGLLSLTAFSGTYSENNIIFILLNDGADAITGTFTDLAQGDVVSTFGGFDWQISYTGNSAGSAFTGGNDVALMAVIPEPRAALLGGLGMLMLLRRRRN